MLGYAALAPRHAERRSSPNAMLAIIAVHVAVIAAVMSAKMDLPPRFIPGITRIDFIPAEQRPPPKEEIKPRVPQEPRQSTLDQPPREVPLPANGAPAVDTTPSLPSFDDLIGPKADPQPEMDPTLRPVPPRSGPQLLTPPSELKPPYPQSKLLSEEEAVLKLRLTIDERGRVIAVEPVGRADAVFVAAARRHLLAHWRYRPASEDGRAVSSSIVISMRFSLEG